MSRYEPPPGLVARPPWRDVLEAEGLRSVADVLGRCRCIRELPDRSNHRLQLGETLVHVKRTKRGRMRRAPCFAAEAIGLLAADGAGVPVAELVFYGVDARLGAVTGTRDLGRARPLDDVLSERAMDGVERRRVSNGLACAVAALHDWGLHHRDLYLNHVYVDPRQVDPVIALIDWDRSGGHAGDLGRWVVKDLAALAASVPAASVSAWERLRFLRRYLQSRGLPAGREGRRLAKRILRREARMRAHVPRTPVGEAARPDDGA